MAHGILEPTPRTALAPCYGFDKMLVTGTWGHGRGNGTGEDLDPYTIEVLVRIPLADGRDVDEAYRAVAAAKREWSDSRPGEGSAVRAAVPGRDGPRQRFAGQ
jgi:hypothetical protein